MRKWLLSLLLILSCLALSNAQELTETYTFVDGTAFNYPSDFLPFNEDYDRVSLANANTDIFVFVTFARTIESQKLDTLPQVLEWYFGNPDVYEIGDEEAITLGEREAIRFEYEVDNGRNDYSEIYIAIPVGENGSVAIVRIQPNIERDIFEMSEEELSLQIVESIHFEDLRGDLSTVLGNSFAFDDGLMIEHRSEWIADAANKSLSNDSTIIRLSSFTPEELAALNRKADPIEILYYEIFKPIDNNIVFNPDEIVFENIRGREGVRYNLLDTVGEETVQRIYFVTLLENGVIVALDIQARLGFDVLQDSDIQDMIQTLRPEGTLPPVTMMELESSFNLEVAVVRFPEYWQVFSIEGGAVSLASLDVNVYIFGFDAEEALEEGYTEDLSAALVEVTNPFDDDVELRVEDVTEFTLENGRPAAQLTYTETDDQDRVYPRRVMLVLLEDNTVIFVGISPQPGIKELSPENEAEVRAIINTISPR